jgi:hypothetical protein
MELSDSDRNVIGGNMAPALQQDLGRPGNAFLGSDA